MNFTNFLIERMLKQDYNKVLADPNIKSGVEYEFLSHDIHFSEFDDEEIGEAYIDYLNSWINFGKAIEDAALDAISKEKAKLVNNAQADIDNLDPDDEDYEENLDFYRDRLAEIQDMDAYEVTDEIEDWKPVDNAIKNIEPPQAPSELGYYFSEMRGADMEATTEKIRDEVIQSVFSDFSFDAESAVDRREIEKILDNHQLDQPVPEGGNTTHSDLEDSLDIDELPEFFVGNHCIGDVDGCPTSKWRIDTDSSLPYGGVEIASPILPLKDTLSTSREMFDYIRNHGKTSNDTGLHVTLSSTAKKFPEADLLKLLTFADEELVYKFFPERMNSQHAKNKKGLIDGTKLYDSDKQYLEMLKKSKPALNKEFQKLVNKTRDRYVGINAMLDGKNPRIEFRYMGGRGYEDKYEQFYKLVMNYAYWLKLATDPEYKKDEYQKRLARLLMRGQREVGRVGKYVYPHDLKRYKILYKPKSVKAPYQFVHAEKDGTVFKLKPTDGAKYEVVGQVPKAKFNLAKLNKQVAESQAYDTIKDLLA